ncbi:MAG: twin-arginine translocase TatA/TatE family subunit [candidate division Zixibacteria bacterium]|nr:twin-arginine translocase TatA/TatE family subunit [candidate division Zixibacteria bacterium]MBU1471739.1 twin-arginine translocase TatA/TatE family subunit [candidate division Zixibacteria bacterium]MBU2625163.1 twin-arginine translocase TatA/TatE family subunit [candidate division Zixibacteria bacterium]
MFGGGIGFQELLLIFLVVLILFGARRIPDIAQGLGKGIREFKKAVKDTQDEISKIDKPESSKPDKIEDKGGDKT